MVFYAHIFAWIINFERFKGKVELFIEQQKVQDKETEKKEILDEVNSGLLVFWELKD
jgi:hypothetical protein